MPGGVGGGEGNNPAYPIVQEIGNWIVNFVGAPSLERTYPSAFF
jgi:hypothetical protein